MDEWLQGVVELLRFMRRLECDHIEIPEYGTALSAPGDGRVRIYVRDAGSGKSQLVAQFPTGAAQVIATEP